MSLLQSTLISKGIFLHHNLRVWQKMASNKVDQKQK
jgi:hypothetical protein